MNINTQKNIKRWKKIKELPYYSISNDGKVKNNITNKLCYQRKEKIGLNYYNFVILYDYYTNTNYIFYIKNLLEQYFFHRLFE